MVYKFTHAQCFMRGKQVKFTMSSENELFGCNLTESSNINMVGFGEELEESRLVQVCSCFIYLNK